MSETNLYSRALLYFKGHCCISYEVCPDEDNAFSLSSKANSLVDNFCNEDYIIIESSMNSCKGNIITHRYCGRVLNSVGGQTINHNICGNSLHIIIIVIPNRHRSQIDISSSKIGPLFLDCTVPFTVSIVTNAGQSPPASVQDRGK